MDVGGGRSTWCGIGGALWKLWRGPVEPIRHSAVISGAKWIQEEGRGVNKGRKERRKTDESEREVSRFDSWRGRV